MRKLQTHDLFKAMKIVNAAGVREEVKTMAKMVEQNKMTNIKEVGIDFILSIIEKCGSDKVEKLIYDFIAGPLEMDPETIGAMDALEFVELLSNFGEVVDLEGWKAFFKSLSALMK